MVGKIVPAPLKRSKLLTPTWNHEDHDAIVILAFVSTIQYLAGEVSADDGHPCPSTSNKDPVDAPVNLTQHPEKTWEIPHICINLIKTEVPCFKEVVRCYKEN